MFLEARIKIFSFVYEYLKVYRYNISKEAALEIKKQALSLFRRDESSKLREICLEILKKIIKYQFLTSQELQSQELYNILLNEVILKRISSSNKRYLLLLLGLISEMFPENVNPDKLLDIYMDNLKTQSISQKPEILIITGCFEGLSYHFSNFPKTVDDGGEKILKLIYGYMKLILDSKDSTRYSAHHSALLLLSKHSYLFKEFLTSDVEKAYERLEYLCLHPNQKLKKYALICIENFVNQVCYEITRNVRDTEIDKKTFEFLFLKVKGIMDNNDKFKTQLAVVIFGQMALPMKIYSGKEDLMKFLISLFKLSDQIFTKNENDIKNYISHIPRFIHAFSNILIEIEDMNTIIMESLERLVTIIMITFPQNILFKKYKIFVCQSLMKLFLVLYLKKDALNTFLNKIIMQGLMFTLSYNEISPEISYFEFWKNIINENNFLIDKWGYPYNELKIDKEIKQEITSIIYDKIIESIMNIIDKLDLSCLEDGEKPKNAKDFAIFINLVSFCEKIIKEKKSQFMKWVYIYSKFCIEKSMKYPYVSGFYKLLTFSMDICQEFKYFEKSLIDIEESFFKLIKDFYSKTIYRINEFKSELLSSCLHFIFSLPKQFVDIKQFTDPLILCFEIGLSYYPLVNIGLNTIERWLKEFSIKEISYCLPDILVYFNKYLNVKGDGDKDEELKEIQKRIIKILGNIGGENSKILDLNNENPIAWENIKRLLFPIKYQDISSEFYLDTILPRIVTLAVESSERKTKIAACELLHTILIYMIGKSATSPKRQKDSSLFFKIYEKIFPNLIKLAVDSEPVTNQLFEPLIYQITHWFTQNIQYENKETMALLDSIVEGVVNHRDGSIRELCANLTNEFLKWSLKHSKNINNAKSLIQRLFSHLLHPNPHHRLGAVISFNKMYRTMRENDEIIDDHFMEILHNTIISLKLAKENISLIEKTLELISHLEKVILIKSDLLIKEIERPHHQSLKDMVNWLFDQCASKEEVTRKQTIKLFSSLVIQLPDYRDEGARKYFAVRLLNEGNDFLKKIAENFTVIENVFEKSNEEKKNEWILELETSVDNLYWLFSNKFIVPHQLFTIKKRKREDDEQLETLLFNHIELYLSTYQKHKSSPSLLLKVIQFIRIMLEKFQESIPKNIIDQNLLSILLYMILLPKKLGFNTNNEKTQNEIVKVSRDLFNILIKDEKHFDHLKQLYKEIRKNEPDTDMFNLNILYPILNYDDTKLISKGYKYLYSIGIFNDQNDIIKLANSIFNVDKKVNPVQKLLLKELLQFCFDSKFPKESLLKFLLDETEWGKSDYLAQKLGSVNDSMIEDGKPTNDHVKMTTKGLNFYNLFKEEINYFISKNVDMIQDLFKYSIYNPFIFNILLEIKPTENIVKEYETFISILLSHVEKSSLEFKISSSRLLNLSEKLIEPNHKNFNVIFNTWKYFLHYKNDNEKYIDLKLNSIKLISKLINIKQYENETIQSLKKMISNDFPLSFQEIKVDSIEYNDHLSLIEELLLTLQSSKNFLLFEQMFFIFRYIDHPLESKIQRFLSKYFFEMNAEEITQASNLIIHHFYNDNLPVNMRRVLITKILSICFEKMTQPILVDFFVKNIKKLTDNFNLTLDNSANITTVSFVFYILELMYKLVPSNIIKETITNAYLNEKLGTGKELTERIMRFSYDSRKITINREFHCNAFKLLVQSIMCTQTQEKIYNGLIFTEKNIKFWELMFDLDKKYEFEIETNFKSYQDTLDEMKLNEGKYISISYLADSSLEELSHIGSFYIPGSRIELKMKTKDTNSKLVVEMDEFNAHPIMETMLNLIDHMEKIFKNSTSDWIQEIIKKAKDHDTPFNLKLFFAKLILNRPKLFDKYKECNEILIQVAVKIGNEVNYFVRDICIHFLKSEYIPERSIASQFISMLMKRCSNTRKVILQSNLQIIKLLFEKWKGNILVDKNIIVNWLNIPEDKKDYKVSKQTGLQLLGILITNDFEIHEEKIIENVINSITSPSKEIYSSASEICGMLYTQLKRKSNDTFNFFIKMLTAKHNLILSKEEFQKILISLTKISIRGPEYLDYIVPKLFDTLSKLPNSLIIVTLRLFNERPDKIVFKNLYPFLKQFLQHNSGNEIQLYSLQLIHKLLKNLEKDEIMKFLEVMKVKNFNQTFSDESRSEYYDILIWLFDNKEGFKEIITNELLVGINDSNDEIKKKLLEFWDKETRLSGDSHRLQQLFTTFFDKGLGENWIKYSVYLLLKLFHKNPEFNDKNSIFSDGLAQCEFKEYKIDVRQKNLAIETPLFATLEYQTLEKNEDKERGYILATYTPEFQPTSTLLFNTLESSTGTGSLPRNRFKKLSSQDTGTLIERNMKLKQEKESYQKRMKEKKPIHLLRKYRNGELPDIQISISEFIIPLENLCLIDLNISKLLFFELFKSITEKSKKVKLDMKIIENILIGSKDIPSIVNLLFNIVLSNEYLMEEISSSMVKNIATSSLNFETGILLIEQKIYFEKKKGDGKALITSHYEVGKLYKKMEDEDVIKSIFQGTISRQQITKDALTLETMGKYSEALTKYNEGLEKFKMGLKDIQNEELQFWKEEKIEILKKLNRWEEVINEMPIDIWNSGDFYMPFFIESYSKVKKDEFKVFVEKSFEESSRKEFLEKKFPLKLSLISIYNNKKEKADFYLKKAYNEFINDWSSNVEILKKNALSKVQEMIEIEEFLTLDYKSIQINWKRIPNLHMDSLNTWDTIINNRIFFYNILKNNKNEKEIDEEINHIYLLASKAARKQNNNSVSTDYIRKITEKDNFEYFKNLIKNFIYKSESTTDLEINLRVIKFIEKNSQYNNKSLMINALIELDKKMGILKRNECEIGSRKDIRKMIIENYKNLPENSKISFNFGSFCYQLYLEDPNLELAKEIIKNYSIAMKLGNIKAQQRFPLLIDIFEKYPESQKSFNTEGINITMFIDWISQMLSRINEITIDILIKIAEQFPQVLYYQYNIVKEDLIIKPNLKQKIEQFESKIQNPLLKKFINHLERLTHPEFRWKYWVERIKQMNNKSLWNEMYKDLFDYKLSEIGTYNRKFAEENAPIIKSKYGQNGEKLTNIKDLDSKVIIENKDRMKSIDNSKLICFSEWLHHYQSSNQNNSLSYIELPCSGYRENSIKITNFDSNILLLSSMRIPKRIKIYGSDEKEYYYLVKGGEDLRQDQRIEELFKLMNSFLKNNEDCRKRELLLRTYDVIPMSKTVGMLEWVKNTAPLKEIIDKQLTIDLKEDLQCNSSKFTNEFFKWMKEHKLSANDGWPSLYRKIMKNLSKDNVSNLLKMIWKVFPKNILANALQSYCTSQESYFKVRNKFIKNYSTLSLCSYILGIGDRHLENFLIDTKDGNIVAIDFGHAFGSATEILGVPELVPFRLTRQITSLIPLFTRRGDNIIVSSMCHTLEALRENKELLLTTMEIFVKEPLVEWIKMAKKLSQKESETGSIDFAEEDIWYPKRKIENTKRKLELANPVSIMVDELKTNTFIKNDFKYFEKIVKGNEKEDIRANHNEICKNVKSQVECLIDLATDINILGRTYVGWCPWV